MSIRFSTWIYESYPKFPEYVKYKCISEFNSLYQEGDGALIEKYINDNIFGEYRADISIKDICVEILNCLIPVKRTKYTELILPLNMPYKDSAVSLEILFNTISYGIVTGSEFPILLDIYNIVNNTIPEIFAEFEERYG